MGGNGRFHLGLGLASNGRADPGGEMEERRRDEEGRGGTQGWKRGKSFNFFVEGSQFEDRLEPRGTQNGIGCLLMLQNCLEKGVSCVRWVSREREGTKAQSSFPSWFSSCSHPPSSSPDDFSASQINLDIFSPILLTLHYASSFRKNQPLSPMAPSQTDPSGSSSSQQHLPRDARVIALILASKVSSIFSQASTLCFC